FCEIEIGIAREIRIRVILHVIGKFLFGKIRIAAVIVSKSVVVEHVRRRYGELRRLLLLLLLLLAGLRGETLLRLLHSLKLSGDFAEARFELVEAIVQSLKLT